MRCVSKIWNVNTNSRWLEQPHHFYWQPHTFQKYLLEDFLFALWLPWADDSAWWHQDPIRDWQNMILIDLPHSVSEKSWMVGDWCARQVLTPWVLIMLWLKVKSNTDWTNIYNCISLIGASWEKCSFCRGCMSKMNVSCAEQIIKAIWEQFCQAKETNSKKYQIILSREFLHHYSFDLYVNPILPWDIDIKLP